MKLNLNKKAIAIALSLALATPIISATALPTLSVFAGGFASNPAVAQGHAIPNTDDVNISGNTVTVALEGTGISDAVKATTSVTITNNAGSTIVTAPALTWTGSTGAWTRFSFQLPANWQTLFHNSEQMGVKVSSTVGSSTFNATANKIVNNDTQIRIDIPAAGATTLSAHITGGSLYSNTVAQSLNDYTYEYTVAPQVSGSITTAANAIFSASSNIVALSNATATPDASGNFTLTLPAGKSVQSLGANDAIFVRRKAKNSNAQYIFIIDSVATTTTTTPAVPAVATPSTPRATSSTATIKPATPSNSIIATGSNSRKSSGGSSSGGGSGRRSSSNNYTATTPSQTPAAPSVTPAAQNTAGDTTKAPSPVGPSARKNTRGKLNVPKTADASDMTGSVMMLFGSLVAMGMVAGVTKKKED